VTARKNRASAPGKTLGALLVSQGVVTEDQVREVLEAQEREGGLLGQRLVRDARCPSDLLAQALNKQRTITTVHLGQVPVCPDLKPVFSRAFCLRHRLLPFERLGANLVCVAMANVLDTQAKNQVRQMTNAVVKPFDAEWNDLQAAIDRWYPASPNEMDIELPGPDPRPARRPASAKEAETRQGAEAAPANHPADPAGGQAAGSRPNP